MRILKNNFKILLDNFKVIIQKSNTHAINPIKFDFNHIRIRSENAIQ